MKPTEAMSEQERRIELAKIIGIPVKQCDGKYVKKHVASVFGAHAYDCWECTKCKDKWSLIYTPEKVHYLNIDNLQNFEHKWEDLHNAENWAWENMPNKYVDSLFELAGIKLRISANLEEDIKSIMIQLSQTNRTQRVIAMIESGRLAKNNKQKLAKDVDRQNKQERMSLLGEIIHVAFRKAPEIASNSEQAWGIWKLIRELPKEDWRAILEWVDGDIIANDLYVERNKIEKRK